MATDLSQLLANPELAGFDRQRKMAQLLVQQGLQTPQGQMVGDRYVPANPLAFIGNLFQQYAGQKSLEDIDQKELAMAKALRQQDLTDLQAGMQLYQGTPGQPAIPEAYKMLQNQFAPRDDEGNLMPGTSYTPAKPAIEAVAPNREAAMARLLGSTGAKSSAVGADLYKQMFAQPEWKAEKRYENGLEVNGWVNVKSPNPSATFIKSSQRPDLEMAKAIDEGYLPQGSNVNAPANVGGGQSNFANSVNKVLSFEGGFVAKDGLSGAPANFGINQKANPDIDVKNLTVDQAKGIYKTRYWDAIGADNLPPKTAEIAFDAAVNQGTDYAKKLIQSTGGDPAKMLAQRAQDYQAIVKANPEQAKFLPSWMKRLEVLSKDGQQPQAGNTSNLPPKSQRVVDLKTAEAKAEYAQKAPAAIEFMNQTMNTINSMIGDTTVDAKGNIVKGKIAPHPGFEGAVGISGIGSGFGAAGYIPGTDVQDFKVRFKQLEGQGFLQAFETLKGAGQITEIEGAKATAALNRMNLAQSEKEFIVAAREFESNVKKGMEIAKERAGMPSTPSTPATNGWSVISVTPGK
jgi:hypothetical protein